MPLFAWFATSRAGKSLARTADAALILGALGWVFVVHWALVCAGVKVYGGMLALHTRRRARGELIRLGLVLFASLLLVASYLYFLVQSFPGVNFPTNVYPHQPQRSVWGDAPAATHSLLFLVTVDLGINFFLACYGVWVTWSRKNGMDLLWLGFTVSSYIAWSVNAYLLLIGQARVFDDVYFFLVVTVAVQAAVRLEDILSRAGTIALLCWFPLTFAWWLDAPGMDPHFRLSRTPFPERQSTLAEWIRTNTEGQDIFFAGADVAIWIPPLSGRRVLRTGMPWVASEAHDDERRILFPESAEQGRAAVDKLGIDYVVFDLSLASEHELAPDHFEEHPLFELV